MISDISDIRSVHSIGVHRSRGRELSQRSGPLRACLTSCERLSKGLTEGQLDTPYRPGGWTVRQVVHHLGDSHVNGFSRLKLALTEDNPALTPFDPARWAALPDRTLDVGVTLRLLEAHHTRWTTVLRSLAHNDLDRPVRHVEYRTFRVERMVHLYAWHSKHHVRAHNRTAPTAAVLTSGEGLKGMRTEEASDEPATPNGHESVPV